jgi:hypothetical protein
VRGWWENHNDREQPPTGGHTPPLVLVYWWDAISYGVDWTDETEPAHPCPTVTVGWMTHNTPEAVTIVPLVNPDQWGNGITIPWGCIQHTHTITPPDPPRRRRKHPTT